MELFEDEYGVNHDPEDNTDITTTILYFSKPELERFKKLCKAGIKQMFGAEFMQRGNLPDFLLNLLQEKYGENNT